MMTFICFCLVSACKVEKSWMKNLSMVCVLCGDGREVVDEEPSQVRESPRRQGIYGPKLIEARQ